MAQRRWKPDRTLSGVVPTLFCISVNAPLLAKLSGARTALHIQDYEVDAMLGWALPEKAAGGKVAQLATAKPEREADCITSITSPRFRVR